MSMLGKRRAPAGVRYVRPRRHHRFAYDALGGHLREGLRLREKRRSAGRRHEWKTFKHVIPNILPLIITNAASSLGGVILMEASLNFLGYGVDPGTPSWGYMITNQGKANMFVMPMLAVYPGICIGLMVFGATMFGDAVRDLLDPRLKGGVGTYNANKLKKIAQKMSIKYHYTEPENKGSGQGRLTAKGAAASCGSPLGRERKVRLCTHETSIHCGGEALPLGGHPRDQNLVGRMSTDYVLKEERNMLARYWSVREDICLGVNSGFFLRPGGSGLLLRGGGGEDRR